MHSYWRKICQNEKPARNLKRKMAKCITNASLLFIENGREIRKKKNTEEMKWEETNKRERKNVVAPHSFLSWGDRCKQQKQIRKDETKENMEGSIFHYYSILPANANPIHCMLYTKAQAQATKATTTTTGNW